MHRPTLKDRPTRPRSHPQRRLHTIALVRRRIDPTTSDYVTHRTQQSKTDPEINRCLKRYLARKMFRIMEATATLT